MFWIWDPEEGKERWGLGQVLVASGGVRLVHEHGMAWALGRHGALG